MSHLANVGSAVSLLFLRYTQETARLTEQAEQMKR